MNDLVVLAILLAGPQHGYALKKQVGLISGRGELHNNLIYPLLRRFAKSGWISKRTAAGQRGQTREIYALTSKGKQELVRRLGSFTKKEAGLENAFRLRVGLFDMLDAETRRQILTERDAWLAGREERLTQLSGAVNAGLWGGEVIGFLRRQIREERRWISRLKRNAQRRVVQN
jgi:DNA-binding PadR family transcriptional regulator